MITKPTKTLIRLGSIAFLGGLIALSAIRAASAQGASPTPTPQVTASQPEPGCYDFKSQEEAQEFFEEEGGPDEDPHGLDSDGDGIACEGLSEVGVAAAFGLILAQATSTPTPTPSGSASPTPSGSASPTASASASPTASSSATPVPTTSGLPKTGGPVYVLAIVALCLVLSGLFLVGFAQARRLSGAQPERGGSGGRSAPGLLAGAQVSSKAPRRHDDYDLLGF